jgi:hypothetical protein
LAKGESAVRAAFGLSPDAFRHQTWRNLRAIRERLNVLEMLPQAFPISFLAV